MEGVDGIEVAKMVEVESTHWDRDDVSHLALDIGGNHHLLFNSIAPFV